MTRHGMTDVAGIVEHWRQAAATARPFLEQSSIPAYAAHIAAHLRDTALGDDADRARQLRAVGEALIVAVHLQLALPGATYAGPQVLAQAIAGLQLVDEAFALATVSVQDTS